MECVLPYGKTLREAVLYVLNIKGETPLVVSNPPVLGNFTRATAYETIHAVKLNECGVRESIVAWTKKDTIWYNPEMVVSYHEKDCLVVE